MVGLLSLERFISTLVAARNREELQFGQLRGHLGKANSASPVWDSEPLVEKKNTFLHLLQAKNIICHLESIEDCQTRFVSVESAKRVRQPKFNP